VKIITGRAMEEVCRKRMGPQRLKAHSSQSGYRSAEALRRPKSTITARPERSHSKCSIALPGKCANRKRPGCA
jgi:hypothetical protein